MRKEFANELHEQMKQNKDIWLICLDLGYGLFDKHFKDFPNRTLNPGAAEQAGMDIACGLAIEGKIPFIYSITTFLLYRPFETLRTYIDHEKLNVKLCMSGRDFDYKHDGWSHHSPDAKNFLDLLPEIVQFWPETKEEIPKMVKELIFNKKPSAISLRRG